MTKQLSSGKSIILFRFYKDFEIARERTRILKNFDPIIPVYGLYGGVPEDWKEAVRVLGDAMTDIWHFKSAKTRDWKWMHTDLMQKDWFRNRGHKIDFDFMFSYEYDLLTADSLINLYPDIDENTLALSAVEQLDNVESRWDWTAREEFRPNFVKFCRYMNDKYGLGRQRNVCLGPGPLLPRKFMEKFAQTEDVDFVHEEITYPAYAEFLGFKLVDNNMHPGFYKGTDSEKRLFNCNGNEPSLDEIFEQLKLGNGRRSFHPVKVQVRLEDVLSNLAKTSVK